MGEKLLDFGCWLETVMYSEGILALVLELERREYRRREEVRGSRRRLAVLSLLSWFGRFKSLTDACVWSSRSSERESKRSRAEEAIKNFSRRLGFNCRYKIRERPNEVQWSFTR